MIQLRRNEEMESDKFSELPHKIMKFFMPTRKIIPQQFHKKSKMVSREHEWSGACYTHTSSYLGKCYVICDNQIIARCGH